MSIIHNGMKLMSQIQGRVPIFEDNSADEFGEVYIYIVLCFLVYYIRSINL